MKYMTNVPYLEVSDFNGTMLKQNVNQGKPAVIMVQSLGCGHCSQAKPTFAQFAQSNQNVFGGTIQIDSDPQLGQLVAKIAQIPGVPVYFGFNRSGQFVRVHQGGRDLASLNAFANSLN